jgi:hypothetical protein
MITVTRGEDRLTLYRAAEGKAVALLHMDNQPEQEITFDLEEGLSGEGLVRFGYTEPTQFLRVMVGAKGQRPSFTSYVMKAELDELRAAHSRS